MVTVNILIASIEFAQQYSTYSTQNDHPITDQPTVLNQEPRYDEPFMLE